MYLKNKRTLIAILRGAHVCKSGRHDGSRGAIQLKHDSARLYAIDSETKVAFPRTERHFRPVNNSFPKTNKV